MGVIGKYIVVVMVVVWMFLWVYELNRMSAYQALLEEYFKKDVKIEDCISVDEPGQVRVCLVRVGVGNERVVKLNRDRVLKSDVVTKEIYFNEIKKNK